MGKKGKKSKKSKKHKAEKKAKKSPTPNESDSCSESEECSENEWVEKKLEKPSTETSFKRDDWMNTPFLIPEDAMSDNKKKSKVECPLVPEAGQSDRELNPFWKHGGSGLPSTADDKNSKSSHSSTQDAEWLKKALRRAKQQAEDEGRSLNSVVADRYGSLETLYQMIDEAENKERHSRHDSDRRRHRGHQDSRLRCDKSSLKRFSHYDRNNFDSFKDYNSSTSRGWRKSKKVEDIAERPNVNNLHPSRECTPDPLHHSEREFDGSFLSDAEMNVLASKIVKAEIMGNQSLVKELNEKLENARQQRTSLKTESSKEKTVLLTTTNASGVTQPVRGLIDKNSVKKRKKFETHIDGERIRYFEDDDKYSLNEMYERERTVSAADHNAEFLRLSSKKSRLEDDEVTEMLMPDKIKDDKCINSAINEQKKREKILDECTWCMTNNKLQKHLIIHTGSKCYLHLPYYQPLTDGHCLISPIYHSTCATLLDEDIWEEILGICKNLVNVFRKEDQDIVFFEVASHFKYCPHMVIHCVPIPYETGNLAPIYFKKAILECEHEWAQNKKLVDMNRLDVKRAIPKGLPYFMVNFGLSNGYAHVIEDENSFPKNFAQEIIGGMLDLDHRIWRKHRTDNFENQCKRVNKFKKLFENVF